MVTMKKPDKAQVRIQLNNSGVTLVELIVALLILAIIVVPLMGVFTSAARTNAVNTKRADADVTAQNIMEAVKVFGLEETSRQVNKFVAGGTCLGMNPSATVDMTPGGSFNEGTGKFIQNAGNIYTYVLENVTEGSHTYDITIEFDSNYTVVQPTDPAHPSATPEVKDVNNVDVYDLSALSEKTTVFVNPLSGAVYYDEDAFTGISELNEILMDAAYERELARVQEENAAKQRAYDELVRIGYPDPTREPDSPLPNRDDYAVKYPKDFVDDINRVMQINIAAQNVSEGGASKRVYKINSVLDYVIPVGSNLVDGDALAAQTVQRSGYCHDVTVDDINTIYVMYTPYPYMCKSAFDTTFRTSLTYNQNTNHTQYETYLTPYLLTAKVGTNKVGFDHESIQINNLTDKNIEVYLIVQGAPEMEYDDSKPLSVNVTGNVELFSKAPLKDTAYTNVITKVTSDEHQDKLISVKVTVKDKDSDVERTVESTIQR